MKKKDFRKKMHLQYFEINYCYDCGFQPTCIGPMYGHLSNIDMSRDNKEIKFLTTKVPFSDSCKIPEHEKDKIIEYYRKMEKNGKE